MVTTQQTLGDDWHALCRSTDLENGGLADVAPTILKLLGLAQPSDMTGRSLIVDEGANSVAAQ